MTVDLKALAARVRHEVENYEIPTRHPELLGTALPESWYAEKLAAMRNGLLDPYWAEVVDYDQTKQAYFTRKIIIIAHDERQNYLAYDPQPNDTSFDNDFAMVGTEEDGLHIYNVRGDAVGTFLSF
ncbi:MAG: hypothetical protein ACXU8U_00705 [Asticcacaulis sp.]